jgi:predicted Rossmann-fold nucleotide-binding protein
LWLEVRKNPVYEKHAGELGSLIAACGIQLIYGGGNMGIMSAVANSVLSKGGKVTGLFQKYSSNGSTNMKA